MKYSDFVNEIESLYITGSENLYRCKAKIHPLAHSLTLHDTPIALVIILV